MIQSRKIPDALRSAFNSASHGNTAFTEVANFPNKFILRFTNCLTNKGWLLNCTSGHFFFTFFFWICWSFFVSFWWYERKKEKWGLYICKFNGFLRITRRTTKQLLIGYGLVFGFQSWHIEASVLPRGVEISVGWDFLGVSDLQPLNSFL